MRKLIDSVLVLALAAFIAPAADTKLAGVWNLNRDRSHFSKGDVPLSLVLTITADGPDGIQYTSKNHLVDGSRGGASFRAKFDGKDYPLTGSPSYDVVSIRRINSEMFNFKMKKDGAVVVDETYTVAADGKSLTRKGTARRGAGEVNEFSEWFDRQ